MLPIDAVLPEIRAAVRSAGACVVEAPPGAGKTTRVPLALLEDRRRIVMLEPRRLAARAAAERMAETLGEPVGRTVGYRMRGEARVSAETRVEVVTDGLFLRRLQRDPGLEGVDAVIFDEVHERGLDADLSLALTSEVRSLRDDLALVAMSATLDAGPIAALLAAPVVRSEGRAFPVETRWLDRPAGPLRGRALADAMADLVGRALAEAEGDVLAFLPGAAEIRALADRLARPGLAVRPLYAALPPAEQRAALAPAETRKVVLATSIAETSLTIEGIRVVVDAGLARRSRVDAAGMGRLVTERAARAEVDQRRGRAGRTAPGICFRLWAQAEEGAFAPHPPPEIETGDLTGLALDLAAWGARPGDLAFLTPPPAGPLAEAEALLTALGALEDGRITRHGRALAALPVHPRLAHMLATGGGAALAALASERDPLRGAPADATLRLEAIRDARAYAARHPWPADSPTLARIRAEAKRLAPLAAEGDLSPGALASLAWPDRIGLRRPGEAPRYLLSGGRGAALAADDPMRDRLIVAIDLEAGREARIRMAVPVTEAELRALHPLRTERVCAWDKPSRRVLARERVMLGALALEDRNWAAPEEAVAAAAAEGLRALGLGALDWTPAARRFRARMAFDGARDVSDAALLADLGWLRPWLGRVRTAADLALDPLPALRAMLSWEEQRRMDARTPAALKVPTGREVPIDYGAAPELSVRVQELFGLTAHPMAGGRPVVLHLLSPAGRPVQTTSDLPGFWASSWADVRKDMRGRYPRHPWPEDPTAAAPTRRAKPR